jgi:hypothetical protein
MRNTNLTMWRMRTQREIDLADALTESEFQRGCLLKRIEASDKQHLLDNELIDEMGKALEAKDKRIAELEAENNELEDCQSAQDYTIDRLYDANVRLMDENERLRDALEKLAKLGNEPHYGNSDGNLIAQRALAAATEQSDDV